MKHLTTLLLLSLALILSANAWADEEFPIELTCEFGTTVYFLSLEKSKEGSWIMHHNSSTEKRVGGIEFDTDKKSLRNLSYQNKYIEIVWGVFGFANSVYINRFNLGASVPESGGKPTNGQCYKGFKEYEKQI